MDKIRTIDDIRVIEQRGLDAFLPNASPFQIIEASARHRPQAIAIRYLTAIDAPERDVAITYHEFAGRIRQAANLFRRLGVGATDAVAVLAPHAPATQIALWAAELAGRVASINPMLRPEHVIELIKTSGAKIAVILGANGDVDVWSKLVPALRGAGVVSHILDCDADGPTDGSDGCFEHLIADERSEALDFDLADEPDAIAAFFHTGGTTGAPKLALHTRRNEAFVGQATAAMCDLGPQDVVINGFPLFHVAGAFVFGLSVLAAGGEVLIPTRLGMRNKPFISTIWRHVERYRVTAVAAVPTTMSTLNSLPVDADISSMRMLLTGGSPLPTELADAFESGVGKPVRNILGMTECSGVVTIEPFCGPRTPNSTGLRLPFTDVRAFRSNAEGVDFDAPCRPNETGIVALRGPNVSPGYSNEARNAGTFEPGGWLVSGDLGHVDEEGRTFITGRAKDVIIRGAHNIDPSMIEDALLQHPDVALAAAVGQPDAYAGELPVAYVVLKPGAKVDPKTLRAFVAPRVAEPAAQPKAVTVLNELPMTPIGKIYKPALRLLATRRAIEEALEKFGLSVSEYELSCTEFETVVRLADFTRAELARRALLGMPIRYDVR